MNDGAKKTKVSFVTNSMDRTLMYWELSNYELDCKGPEWTIPTLGGFVYTVASKYS